MDPFWNNIFKHRETDERVNVISEDVPFFSLAKNNNLVWESQAKTFALEALTLEQLSRHIFCTVANV